MQQYTGNMFMFVHHRISRFIQLFSRLCRITIDMKGNRGPHFLSQIPAEQTLSAARLLFCLSIIAMFFIYIIILVVVFNFKCNLSDVNYTQVIYTIWTDRSESFIDSLTLAMPLL